MRKRFAVIPTHDRPEEFARCVAAIRPQVDRVIAVCHGNMAWEYALDHDVECLSYDPPGRANISHMWNLGLDYADTLTHGPYDTAILNDDAIPGPDWFTTVVNRMHADGADGASEPRSPRSLSIAGWAFILNGARLRADERFVHWFGDDDLVMQAELWTIVEGITTPNTRAHSTSRSPEARAQIALDRAAFEAKYPA